MKIALLLLAVLSPTVQASDDGRVLPPGETTSDARKTALVTLDSHHPWVHHQDLAAWRERADFLRRQVLVAAGLWPMPPRPPIEAVVHGEIDRGEYRIRKVYFESFPGFYVTGNLYLPTAPADGTRPAVLSPHGHFTNGRFAERSDADVARQLENGWESDGPRARYHLQTRMANLARLGCVVFHYDMVGVADSQQIGHGEGFGDRRAEEWAQSAFGLQTFNSIRALDFLSSLPEVDPERIGVTGASGGGTQTFILCAIDPRPAAAFPAVMVSTGMQGGCICENASHLRIGTGNVELAALFAPRPLMLTGANDWTLHIEKDGLPELKTLYALYGVSWRVNAVCYPDFEHNYNRISREHMYSWFDTHLGLGAELPIREAPIEPVKPAELSVFDAEHPRPEDAVDSKGLKEVWTAMARRQLEELRPHDAESLAEFRRVVGGALEVLLHTKLPGSGGVVAKTVSAEQREGYRLEKLRLARTGSGEDVPAVLLVPEAWSGVVFVGAAGEGKEVFFAGDNSAPLDLETLLERGAALLAIDPLLVGEHLDENGEPRSLPRDEGRHTRFPGYTVGYNRPLLAWRVHDLLTAIAHAREMEGVRSVRLIGAGAAGPWAVLAQALAGEAVDLTAADWGWDFDQLRGVDDPDFLPGALRYGGMPSFAALCAPTPLILRGAPEPELPAAVRDAYDSAGHPLLALTTDTADRRALTDSLATPPR